jgi:hypothetical protein
MKKNPWPRRSRPRIHRKRSRKESPSSWNTRAPRSFTSQQNTQPLDSHGVREWFAAAPAACISNAAAQKILRQYEHPFRLWIRFPGENEETSIRSSFENVVSILVQKQSVGRGKKARAAVERKARESLEKGVRREMQIRAWPAAQELVTDQFTAWWQSLRNHLSDFLPTEIVDRFADYLAGFLLLQENETPRSSATWEDKSKTTNNEFRQFKRLLPKLNGRPGRLQSMLPASTNPPHQESLKTSLIRIMTDELVKVGYSRKLIAEKYLPETWDAIGETIRDSSFLRTERRSRQRTNEAN